MICVRKFCIVLKYYYDVKDGLPSVGPSRGHAAGGHSRNSSIDLRRSHSRNSSGEYRCITFQFSHINHVWQSTGLLFYSYKGKIDCNFIKNVSSSMSHKKKSETLGRKFLLKMFICHFYDIEKFCDF